MRGFSEKDQTKVGRIVKGREESQGESDGKKVCHFLSGRWKIRKGHEKNIIF